MIGKWWGNIDGRGRGRDTKEVWPARGCLGLRSGRKGWMSHGHRGMRRIQIRPNPFSWKKLRDLARSCKRFLVDRDCWMSAVDISIICPAIALAPYFVWYLCLTFDRELCFKGCMVILSEKLFCLHNRRVRNILENHLFLSAQKNVQDESSKMEWDIKKADFTTLKIRK